MRWPNSNLSPMSQPWGRYAQDQIEDLQGTVERLGIRSDNSGRIQSSSMDLMAGQISELYARGSALAFGADATTPVYTTDTVQVSSTITLPLPLDSPRLAWVSLSCSPVHNSTESASVFLTWIMDGVPFHRASTGVPAGQAPPSGWTNPSYIGYTGFIAPTSGAGILEMRMQCRGIFGSGPMTTSLTNVQASINYAQKA